MNMNLYLVKGMVKGEIQTIPQCIFDKFSFPTYGLAKIQNDAKIDKLFIDLCSSIVSLNELSTLFSLIFYVH